MSKDFVELPMHDFDVILVMDWLQSCYACFDCHTRVVILGFPIEEELVWKGYNSSRPILLISKLMANKMVSKGLLSNLVSVNYLDHEKIIYRRSAYSKSVSICIS